MTPSKTCNTGKCMASLSPLKASPLPFRLVKPTFPGGSQLPCGPHWKCSLCGDPSQVFAFSWPTISSCSKRHMVLGGSPTSAQDLLQAFPKHQEEAPSALGDRHCPTSALVAALGFLRVRWPGQPPSGVTYLCPLITPLPPSSFSSVGEAALHLPGSSFM